MTFLAPVWLGVAAAAAIGIVALHLIATHRPPRAPLPTARFVPAGDSRAAARARRPSDLPLLLVRVAALGLLGAAFAGPVRRAGGAGRIARVLLVDRSRASLADTRDSARALWRAGDALVLFDSTARAFADGGADSLAAASVHARGDLSAGVVAARRAATAVARHADSVELVLVSPVLADEVDAATASLLASWPGRARLVRTAGAPATAATLALTSVEGDDPLRPLVEASSGGRSYATSPATVRLVRTAPSAADSALARRGAAVVYWPAAGGAVPVATGVWTRGGTLVAPLARLPLPMAAGATILARWADGSPAADEVAIGDGCLRRVAIGIPAAGDVTLQPAFREFIAPVLAPCAGTNAALPAPDSVARWMTRAGPAAVAAALGGEDEASPFTAWLLIAGLLALALEFLVRRAARLGAA